MIKNIQGFWLGEFDRPLWYDEPPSIEAIQCPDIRGIERDVLVAYWEWLWRMGEYTFGARYVPVGSPPGRRMDLERFADYHIFKLWPEYGRLWSAVGATKWGFDYKIPIHREKREVPREVSRVNYPYDIFLRYGEGLWWAKSVFMTPENKWVFEQAVYIGGVLMFERRGPGVAKKNEDEWNFGMAWFERIMAGGKANWYLWATADVTYLGFGIRKSATLLGLQATKT